MAENTTAVVDQKPKELLPVDPDVKIPDAVKRRSAAVDAYFAQQVKPPEEVTQTPVPPTAQPQAAQIPSNRIFTGIFMRSGWLFQLEPCPKAIRFSPAGALTEAFQVLKRIQA